ncbi:pentatricopeptide repeat-containing protein At3g53360, mitochondrial [Ipomoea triloba]|uniref:pentatricopeptide repeat-containing protein At3g53360, mitochondrial n=1 Tax=Ipomoea triloba TaxID=35885 RepID=UPI00125DE900|nr:pentatricopeptide repeat-containing protein At3g53360, mitochondrial [Ipomoea triloba]XP_031092425.1 pentatricopeptide repeat-containing protein At3g53360, mitochondrial [Ipomoea triloba]
MLGLLPHSPCSTNCLKELLKRLLSTSINISQNTAPNFINEQWSNDYISSLCKRKLFKGALEAFELLKRTTIYHVYPSTYTNLVYACSSLRSLDSARKLYNHVLMSGYEPDMIFQNHVLNMFGKCGSMRDARRVFDQMVERNVVSWTSVIAGYSQNDQEIEAIRLYFQMRQSGIMPDPFTFGSLLKACSNLGELELGQQLHCQVIKSESNSHLIAQNALVAMYTKFSMINEAANVFSRIKLKDLISWSSIIAGFSQLGYELEALHHFREMFGHGIYQANEFIFGSVFSACSSLLQPEYGRQVHGICIKYGLGQDTYAGCSLADMYARCGLLESAKTAFYQIDNPDIVSWNAIITGFSSSGDASEALALFSEMRHLDFTPDDLTMRSLLCAFVSPLALFQGKQVHGFIIKMGFDLYIPVSNTLLSMYSNCSDLFSAYRMFGEIQHNADLVSWNAILTVFIQHNEAGEVFSLFKMMLQSHYKPDRITLVNIVGACGKVASLEMGDQAHCYALRTGLSLDITISNGLIDMYVKCGSMENARKLFDGMENRDVFSWSSLIVGYAQFGYGEEALKLFGEMRNLGVKPSQVTFVGVLTACSHFGLVKEGWQMFQQMEMEHGIVPTREHCSCVVDMFARAGCIDEAEAFINQMPFDPDIVMWKTLLAACKTRNNLDVGRRAAENVLKIDPSNSAAHVLLCNIYASTGNWKDFAAVKGSMRQKGIKKAPGQSWIEAKDRIHVFLAEDCQHPEREKIYAMLDDLWLQMSDADYVPVHV